MTDKEITLDQLEVGDVAKIVKIGTSGDLRRKLMEMGLTRNTEIRVIGKAPLGDPIEYKFRNYNLTLRKEEASKVIVEY